MKFPIILFLSLILVPITLSLSLSQGQSETIENKVITVISIQESKILISVDGEKAILSLNEKETVNGIEIILTEIFYAEDSSSVSLDTKLTYSCGDKICNPSESSTTCCSDCGCSGSLKCSQNLCIAPECSIDLDCNDQNDLTDDSCSDYKCKHKEVKCEKNLECNDNNPETDDLCIKGSCQNLPPICSTDEDCSDQDPCTLNQCINKDCMSSQIPDCEKKEIKEVEKEMPKIENKSFIGKFFSWIKNIFS